MKQITLFATFFFILIFFLYTMSLLCMSPWTSTLQIFLNLVAYFVNLILRTSLEGLPLLLKSVSVLCRRQRCKDGACSHFLKPCAILHLPGEELEDCGLLTEAAILSCSTGIFSPVLPLCFEYLSYEDYPLFFSCETSHGFFSNTTEWLPYCNKQHEFPSDFHMYHSNPWKGNSRMALKKFSERIAAESVKTRKEWKKMRQ